MLKATPVIFFVLLIAAADFYIKKLKNSMAFRAHRFYLFGGKLLKYPHNLVDEFSSLMKSSFLGFANDKLTKVPYERRSIEQLYMNKMQFFENEP